MKKSQTQELFTSWNPQATKEELIRLRAKCYREIKKPYGYRSRAYRARVWVDKINDELAARRSK
jgi:hypothetical protein